MVIVSAEQDFELWEGERIRRLPVEIQEIARRKLRMLNNSQNVSDLMIPPSKKQAELLPALIAFPDMVLGAGTAEYNFTSLEDFEKLYPTLGMGPKNYGWYQSKLHSAAKDIYNAGGKKVLKKLWEALKKHQEKMTDEEFTNMLEKDVHSSVADVYLKWNKTD